MTTRPHSRKELVKLTVDPRDTCIELGCFRGDFTVEILPYCDKLICVDNFQGVIPIWTGERFVTWGGDDAREAFLDRFKRELATGKVVLIEGDAEDVMADMKDLSADWIYVDANHDYDAVLDNLWEADRVIRRWICGHDYCMCNNFGVVRAVAVFLDRTGYELDYLTAEPPFHVFDGTEQPSTKVSYDSFGIRKKDTK